MRVAIVGARTRNTDLDRAEVFSLVAELEQGYGEDLVVISGGAPGIDTFAEEASRELGVHFMKIRPAKIPRNAHRGQIVAAYHERNEKIVLECEELHAFVIPERKGGTENAIEHARNHGRAIVIHDRPVPDVAP